MATPSFTDRNLLFGGASPSYAKATAGRLPRVRVDRFANNLRDGSGIPQDKTKAYEWYGKAAAKDHLDSINQLAVCYSSGAGVAQDQRQAYKLFKKASNLGHLQAKANLAVCYAKGLGVAEDEDEAARLSLEVINSNDAAAKQILKLLNPET